jgi:hypothetical protein
MLACDRVLLITIAFRSGRLGSMVVPGWPSRVALHPASTKDVRAMTATGLQDDRDKTRIAKIPQETVEKTAIED